MTRDPKSSHNPYDRNETEADRMEAAHHRRLDEIYGKEERENDRDDDKAHREYFKKVYSDREKVSAMKEHEHPRWNKGSKSNPNSHTDE